MNDETRRIQRTRLLISLRLTAYLALVIAVISLGCLHLLKPVICFAAIIGCAGLACLEMCPRCHAPYILQKGKIMFRLGERCSHCEYPIGIPHRKKRSD